MHCLYDIIYIQMAVVIFILISLHEIRHICTLFFYFNKLFMGVDDTGVTTFIIVDVRTVRTYTHWLL